MSILPVRVNYLNNRELLAEIHKSKTSYCYYVDKQYANYDMIADSLDSITAELIETVKEKRATRLMQTQKQEQKNQGLKLHQIKIDNILPQDVQVEDIVWRVMTYEHVPLDPTRSKRPKTVAEKHLKVNFPPFKHYILRDGEFTEVGRSHWINGLHNGEFSQDHGKINNKLAMMFMKLVERYGQRSNWRGYCVDEKTEALTQRGWLNINEITEADAIMSYSEGDMKWSSIKSIYRGEFDGLMHKVTGLGLDSLITPNHKLVTERGLVKVEHMLETDKVVLLGSPLAGADKQVHSDDMVELLAWIITEGNYQIHDDKMHCICIYQNAGAKADRIRQCLINLNMTYSEKQRKDTQLCFAISRKDSNQILDILPIKNLSMNLILSLTAEQRQMFMETLIDGDGWRTKEGYKRYCQKDGEHVDLFQALCAMNGYRSVARKKDIISHGKETHIYNLNIYGKNRNRTQGESINLHGGKRNGHSHVGRGKLYHPNEPTTYYKGMVWCPETEYGSFLAKRNGTVYLTGNTYLGEMRGQALMQLSLVGLQFDESRSDNPFAYYTVTVSNAFTRVLNLEKRNQNIRDDILIMHGATPSMTRQLDDEMQQKAANDAAELGEDAKPVLPVALVKRGAFGRPMTKKPIAKVTSQPTNLWENNIRQFTLSGSPAKNGE